MKNKFIIILIIFSILFISTQVSSLQINKTDIQTLEYDIIFVDKNNTIGPWDGSIHHPFKKISDAIYNASNTDIIFILKGIYKESIVIDKQLTILGENKNNTIIDANKEEYAIKITKNNVIIKDLTIKNTSGFRNDAGIKIESNNCKILQCKIFKTKTGIYCDNSEKIDIKNTSFHTNGGGILLKNSKKIFIDKIQACHNGIGIELDKSDDININDVFLHTNGIGVFIYKTKNVWIENSIISNNNDNQGGVFIQKSDNIKINNCKLYHNGLSIKIDESKNIETSDSNIYWTTHFAFYIKDSKENILIKNSEIANNLRFGIRSFRSKIILRNNNFYNNHLHAVRAEDGTIINGRNNYWGSIFGPSLFLISKGEKNNILSLKTKYFPWKITKIKNIGSNLDENKKELEIPINVHPQINLKGKDDDLDGCPNWWETKWGYNKHEYDDHKNLDPDNDGLNNIEECYTDKWNSDPFHKDLFLEFDWSVSGYPKTNNKPPKSQLDLMKKAFKEHDITLHIDDGSFGGGGEIQHVSNFTYSQLRDLYWKYFLDNNPDNPRKGIFHYGLICDHGPGSGFAFVGWDSLDSFCISAQNLVRGFPLYSRGRLVVTGSMHETGHTLGLLSDDFDGNDNYGATQPYMIDFWIYRNYKSTMNYRYTWNIMDYSDGTNGRVDFDDWGNLDFYFFKDTHFEWPKLE